MDPTSLGATHCAIERNGYCYGPGIVYYGYGEHWTTKLIGDGESVFCSTTDIGCDPIYGQVKDCYVLEDGTCTISDNYESLYIF